MELYRVGSHGYHEFLDSKETLESGRKALSEIGISFLNMTNLNRFVARIRLEIRILRLEELE